MAGRLVIYNDGVAVGTHADLNDEQMAFLDQLLRQWSVADIPPYLAEAAKWCIEETRRQWQAEGDQDGPAS